MAQPTEVILSTLPNWDREKATQFWDPSKKLIKSIRDYQRWRNKKNILATLLTKPCVLRHRFWSIVCGADIPLTSQLGGGVLIPHPIGVVIHPDADIGLNCLIHQHVTIGIKRGDNRPPTIKDHVDIGAGAVIIGNITIGEYAVIGANAVVVNDVLPGQTVAGVPAKAIKSS